jgi:glycosyltransferase involved in cell wall biosynthesis
MIDRGAGFDAGRPGGPDVTVVVPTRNRWSVLSSSALAAAFAQEDVGYEAVVVDDGSTDATPERLAELEEPRLRVVRHERCLGVARARNAGIEHARGEWIAFLDDDDVWSPRKLRRQLDEASARGATFVYGGSVALDEHKRFIFGHAPPDPACLRTELLRRNVMWGGCSNVVVRTDVVRRLGGFDEQLFQLADWDLWIRLAGDGTAARVEDVLVGCVAHRASMLLTDRRDVFREFEYLVDKHRESATALGVRFDQAGFSRWVAAGHLRAGRRRAAARAYLRDARNPGNLGRAAGAFLGESTMENARRLLAKVPGRVPPDEWSASEPDWLSRYW